MDRLKGREIRGFPILLRETRESLHGGIVIGDATSVVIAAQLKPDSKAPGAFRSGAQKCKKARACHWGRTGLGGNF